MIAKYIFIAMYRALDCLYDENPDEELREYVSDANPYLFADRESADPAIAAEFNSYVNSSCGKDDIDIDEAYDIVRQYLREHTSFYELFNSIDLEEWENLCKIVQDEEVNQEACE